MDAFIQLYCITLALMFRAAVTWTSGVTFLKSVGFYLRVRRRNSPETSKFDEQGFQMESSSVGVGLCQGCPLSSIDRISRLTLSCRVAIRNLRFFADDVVCWVWMEIELSVINQMEITPRVCFFLVFFCGSAERLEKSIKTNWWMSKISNLESEASINLGDKSFPPGENRASK